MGLFKCGEGVQIRQLGLGNDLGALAWEGELIKGRICCQVTPPMQSGRVTKVALNDLSIVHFIK